LVNNVQASKFYRTENILKVIYKNIATTLDTPAVLSF